MTSWAQSSQRATCPPRAAVRQLSIADITFNWPRLTWPALALRHAAPWSRKISATSKSRTPHDPGLCGWLGAFGLQRGQAIQRAHNVPDGVGGNARVERGRVELGVAQQNLDHANVDVLLEQVRCKAVPQSMRGDALGD